MKFNNAFWSIHFCIVRNNLWILYKSILYLKNHEKKMKKKSALTIFQMLFLLLYSFSQEPNEEYKRKNQKVSPSEL